MPEAGAAPPGADQDAPLRTIPAHYAQFDSSGALWAVRVLAGALTWPLTIPLALLARLSDVVFRTMSELLAGVPYAPGIVMRGEFYRFALRDCGRNVVIEYGTVFCYRDVSLGSHVLLGRYCVVHHCDIGNYVLAGERCTFLSGSRQHGMMRRDIPMALQPGEKTRIRIADDCWIGSHAVIMEDIETGAVVGAGSVVSRRVPAWSVVAGNPARIIRKRDEGD